MGEDARHFREWLKRQQGRGDHVGLFATLALADPMTSGFGTLIGYWITWAVDHELADWAHCAILEYEASLPEREVLPQ